MKKVFSLLLATALTASSLSAATPEITTFSTGLISATRIDAPAMRADEEDETPMDALVGTYNCRCNDYSIESTPIVTFTITVAQGATENEILITNIADLNVTMVGTVDFETGIITFENQFLRGKYTDESGEYDIKFQHGAWVEDEAGNQLSGTTDKPMEGFIADGGFLIGYPNDIIILEKYQNNEMLERICALSFIVCATIYEDPYTYEPVGDAIFCDGWLLPGFDFNPADYPGEVALERCIENPNQFRLVNPYPTDYLGINEGTEETGYIVFDISTPECVIVYTGYRSGFYETAIWGYGNFYFYNLEGLILFDYEMQGVDISPVEIKNLMLQKGYAISDIVGNEVTIRNCLFGYDASPAAGSLWKSATIEMTSTITLPEGANLGINDIHVDNVPAEYYNLQGIKVANPENGIFIRRQGNKAEKIYVK